MRSAAVERYKRALAKGRPFDAVILDLTLGTESGIDVLASLRLQPPSPSASSSLAK